MKNLHKTLLIIMLLFPLLQLTGQSYRNFKVAVYSRSYETRKMGDPSWIGPVWETVTKQVKVDKIYLETHRDLLIVDQETLDKAKKFFHDRGVLTAGGITYTVNEGNRFETFCYVNPEHRAKVKEIAEYTARNFDEIILDDFFFTSCKCDLCIAAKGERSWTDFRLDLMKEAALDLVIKPAKAVNPKVKVIIKYPNWYEHFQGLGFNLEAEPGMFDGLYTGTETRDPSSAQHLQAYLGYNIFRYFENLKPGMNGGGWVDTGGMKYYDRYAEQLWITLFAKAPEVTLFDIRQLQYPLRDNLKADWQGEGTSFDLEMMMHPMKQPDGSTVVPSTLARVAGYAFEKADRFIGQLGKPLGVKSYKPYQSVGEDFLHNYLGMIGIPMEIVPRFPDNEKVVLLTESASYDKEIVARIKNHLTKGNSVVITSGLLKALQGKGIEDIAEIRHTDRKAQVSDFVAGWGTPAKADREMIIPQISYLTNDAWEEISALDDTNGWPLLLFASYGKGKFYVLTIPDNFTDLYHLPEPVITRMKQVLTAGLPVTLEGPGYASLFLYDNNACIVESFADAEMKVRIVTGPDTGVAENLETGVTYTATPRETRLRGQADPIISNLFELTLKPHSFIALTFRQTK